MVRVPVEQIMYQVQFKDLNTQDEDNCLKRELSHKIQTVMLSMGL
jgi:hypothetical protein